MLQAAIIAPGQADAGIDHNGLAFMDHHRVHVKLNNFWKVDNKLRETDQHLLQKFQGDGSLVPIAVQKLYNPRLLNHAPCQEAV